MKIHVRRTFLTVYILLISFSAYAQNDSIYPNETAIEQLIEYGDDEQSASYDEVLIDLHERFAQPININTADKNMLQQFTFLSDIQIENILAYLYLHGEMQTIYELQLVKDMDWQTIRYMASFFCAKPVDKTRAFPTFGTLWKWGRQEVTMRGDIPFYRTAGYKNKYLGNPYYHSIRYAYHYTDRVYAGITAEKDKGEELFGPHSRKGYDAYSVYLLIKDWARLKTLAIGDYRLSFGQGLVVSNDFLLGKSTYLTTLNRRTQFIRKHSSTDEYNFFRGIAATYALSKKLLLTAFLSYRRMDGTVEGDSLTSINKTGLHRTQKEIDRRNSFSLFLMGSNVNYWADRFQIGATAVYYRFSIPYFPALRQYNKYGIRGNDFYNMSTDYAYRYRRFSFSGETAIGKRGMATINRIGYSPKQGYDFLLFYRYYAHNYWAYFAHSFSEGSLVQNENGWYVAADIQAIRKIAFFAAVDMVSFPWWRYRVSKPSQLVDVMFRTTYQPKEYWKMDFYYRFRSKDRDVSGTKGTDIRSVNEHSFRVRHYYTLPIGMSFVTIADYKLFHQKGFDVNSGCQFTQNISYSFRHIPLQVQLQSSYFHTDGYDTRVYVYERGLLYNFYVPAYQGTGIHLTLRTQYAINKRLLLITHTTFTKYYHASTIGQGSDMINSNKRIDTQLQLRYKW